MIGKCLKKGWIISDDRPACASARAWHLVIVNNHTPTYSLPSDTPVLSPSDPHKPVCGDCNMFQDKDETEKELLKAYVQADALRQHAHRDSVSDRQFRAWAKTDLHTICMHLYNAITNLEIIDRQTEAYQAIETIKKKLQSQNKR